jgi:hypothetical protein
MYMERNMKILEKIYDARTGEETIIERDESAAETKSRLDTQKKLEAYQAEAEAKAQAKTVAEGKLAALGLTTDDLRALGL